MSTCRWIRLASATSVPPFHHPHDWPAGCLKCGLPRIATTLPPSIVILHTSTYHFRQQTWPFVGSKKENTHINPWRWQNWDSPWDLLMIQNTTWEKADCFYYHLFRGSFWGIPMHFCWLNYRLGSSSGSNSSLCILSHYPWSKPLIILKETTHVKRPHCF